ncbi:MAG: hypothetical protein GY757_31055 [bacterium]|nr:hypothetical protein [bacterium]
MAIEKKLIAALLVMAAAIGIMNVFLMPPYMNPDEIQHLIFSTNYAYGPERLQKIDEDVLKQLKKHKWFHFIGMGPGWESVAKIKEIYFLRYFAREKRSISKTYFHYIYGKILKYSGVTGTINAFFLLRLLSFCFYMAIVVLSLLFYKSAFPAKWLYMITGQLLVYQVGTILDSVNYDVMLTFLGVLFFIVSYRFMREEKKQDIVYLLVLAALAALIKTAGILFFLYFFILMLFKYKINMKSFKILMAAIFFFIIVFSWINYLFPDRFFALYTVIFAKMRGVASVIGGNGGAGERLGFFASVFDSFYFHTGWMAFKVTAIWYQVLKVFFFVSLAGVLVGVSLKKIKTEIAEKKWVIYALLVSLLQMGSIYFYYGAGLAAQGRYLYPVLLPIIILVYSGLGYIESYLKIKKNYLTVSYILFQVLFFLLAFHRVITVFYLEIASPHIGL